MGNLFSPEQTEKKTVDSNGAINNNVIFKEGINVLYQYELAFMMLIITIIKIIKLVVIIYQMHKRNLRKTYANRGDPSAA